MALLETIPSSAKFGGATGNFNAHHVAYPGIDWIRFADEFVRERIGLERLRTTTQIEHYDNLAAFFDNLKRINNILIDLAVLRKDHLVFVDQVAGNHRLRAVSAVGELFPLHCTANGKACLALLDDGEVRQRLKNRDLTIAGGKTRTLASLMDELKAIRRSGIAFDEEEHSSGISALGSAFRDQAGTIYAISIPAPTSRFEESRERVAPLLLATRDRLRQIVGTQIPVGYLAGEPVIVFERCRFSPHDLAEQLRPLVDREIGAGQVERRLRAEQPGE